MKETINKLKLIIEFVKYGLHGNTLEDFIHPSKINYLFYGAK